MSKRKYIRKMLRAKAEKRGVKASRYVRAEFDRYQRKKYGKYGAIIRKINQAKGTKKRRTWSARIAALFA